jgi:hypothetical protein
MTLRVLLALIFAATAFVIGLFLPLNIYWLIHGDPGMPGGAALVFYGLPLGIIGAVVTGLFSFNRLPPRKQNSK